MNKNFYYKNKDLYCDNVKVEDIAKKIGTPLYIYSKKSLEEKWETFANAFSSINHLICYAIKSNSNLAVCSTIAKLGSGADIVSGGELYQSKLAGFPPQKIVFAGVGKTAQEIQEALNYGILLINVESQAELDLISRVAKKIGKKANISLRVAVNIPVETHQHINTVKKGTKFGISEKKVIDIYRAIKKDPYLKIAGIHVHLGSQITKTTPFVNALKKINQIVSVLDREGIKIKYIDLGGGVGVKYKDEKVFTPQDLFKALAPLMNEKYIYIFEPGRYISAQAGILVCQVLHRKKNDGKNFVVVNAGMNDFIRPVLYNAYHRILPLKKNSSQSVVDVVGPLCESGDFFGHSRPLPNLKEGDFIAIMDTGAYGFVMASNYNSRPRPAEVMVEGNDFKVVRRAQTYFDLVREEKNG